VRVVVDENLCDGHGKCERIAPEIFKMDESGMAHVLVGELNPAQLEKAKATVLLCPSKAIRLVETSAGGKGSE